MKLLLLLLFVTPFFLLSADDISLKKTKKDEVHWTLDMKNHIYGYLHKDEVAPSGGGGFPGFGGGSTSAFLPNHLTLYNSTRLKARMGHWTFSIRKDLFAMIGMPIKEGEEYMLSNDMVFNHGPKYYLERVALEGRWKRFNFTAGDFYLSLNRGLMLAMTPSDKNGDNSIRGGKFIVKTKGFSVTTFGGYANPMLRDIPLEKRMQDGWDWLFGTDFGYKYKKLSWHLSYTGAYYQPYKVEEATATATAETVKKDFHLVGASMRTGALWKGFSSYAGFTMIADGNNNKTTQFSNITHDMAGAHALYLSARQWWDIKGERLTISMQGNRYSRYFVNYDVLEDPDFKRDYFSVPDLIPDNYELTTPYDNWGMKFRIALAEKRLTKLNISFETALLWSLEQSDQSFTSTLGDTKDLYLGGSIDRTWKQFSFKVLGGYHRKEDLEAYAGNPPKLVEWGYINLLLGTSFKKQSFKSTSEVYIKNDPGEEWNDAVDFRQTLDWTISSLVTFSLLLSYWNDHNEDSDEQHYYPGASISVHYKKVRALIFGGQMRGGKVCTGGVCRDLPDFSGVKLEFDLKM
ncbi:hypothetical protein KAH37_04460 [bacterium]|nr:hypothetical protein [bacterium]